MQSLVQSDNSIIIGPRLLACDGRQRMLIKLAENFLILSDALKKTIIKNIRFRKPILISNGYGFREGNKYQSAPAFREEGPVSLLW
jgi:hypothetical protein